MTALPYIDAAAIDRTLETRQLIDRLEMAFRQGCTVPLRHHHHVEGADGSPGGTLLLMPAWVPGGAMGVKAVSVFPGNAARGLPSVVGLYVLFDAATGVPRAILDGVQLTLRRTAAASALAARYLARRDAVSLLMVGAGALAPHLVRAHAAVRPLNRVIIWNRHRERAEALTARLAAEGFGASAADSLETAVREADIVSCATMSKDPLVMGEWLKVGAHLDLVGGYTPAMREADDVAVRRARLFVDTMTGGLKEAGDIVDPIARGVIDATRVEADLFALCRGERPGRRDDREITLFKSVGTALEDLAAADLVMERL